MCVLTCIEFLRVLCVPVEGDMVESLHEVESQLRQLKAKRKAVHRDKYRGRVNDRRLLQDAFVLYVLTDCNLAAPLALMDCFGRVPHDEVRAHVEQQYLETPVEEMAQYSCVNDCIEPKVGPQTNKFFKEWKLTEWVNKINSDIGTTPSFSNIAEELNAGASIQEPTEKKDGPNPESTRKWIQRWRRKWKARVARVPTQLGADVATLSTKAGRVFFRSKKRFSAKCGVPFWGPFFGPHFGSFSNGQTNVVPKIRASFWAPRKRKTKRQVSTSWSVWNAAEQTATSSGHRVLRCNLDETMLPRSFGNQKGVVVRRRPKGQQKLLAQKNPSRGNLSFAAIICDDTTMQPRLPQVLVGNEHVLRLQDLDAVKASLPANVYLIRRKSCWLDHVLFAQIITWLREAVSKVDKHIQILLLCDASPVHLHPLVLQTSKKASPPLLRSCVLHVAIAAMRHSLVQEIQGTISEAI